MLFFLWSDRGESNPRLSLGKAAYCHCTTIARCEPRNNVRDPHFFARIISHLLPFYHPAPVGNGACEVRWNSVFFFGRTARGKRFLV